VTLSTTIMAGFTTGHHPHLLDFILTDKLGSGTYATVYKAYRKASSCHFLPHKAHTWIMRYCNENVVCVSPSICLSAHLAPHDLTTCNVLSVLVSWEEKMCYSDSKNN